MKPIKLILIPLFIFCVTSFSTKKLMPLSLLKENEVLVFKKNVKGINNYVDTFDVSRINDLSSMEFEAKNFQVEKFGVTPDYSINFYNRNERIGLLSVWAIENNKVSVNINYIKKNKFYSGYVINKELFNSKFSFLDNR